MGSVNSEVLILDVEKDVNLQWFAVSDATYTSSSQISNKHRHTYHFSPNDAKAGDVVALFTGTGTIKKEKLQGSNNHVFYYYMNMKKCVWNDEGDGVRLFKISDWNTKKVNQPLKKPRQ